MKFALALSPNRRGIEIRIDGPDGGLLATVPFHTSAYGFTVEAVPSYKGSYTVFQQDLTLAGKPQLSVSVTNNETNEVFQGVLAL